MSSATVLGNFTKIIFNEFNSDNPFYQLMDAFSQLSASQDDDDDEYCAEESIEEGLLLDMLTDEDQWSVEERKGISVQEMLSYTIDEGWTREGIEQIKDPVVFVMTHDDDFISNRMYGMVLADNATNEIYAISLAID